MSEEGYSGHYGKNCYILELKKDNLFAWIENPYYQYRDFALTAQVSFSGDYRNASLGFCFRQMNDQNYYYFLASTRGQYRLDLVINGNPDILIPWTPFNQDIAEQSFDIRIVALGDRFTFFINDLWIGEIDNDAIASGGFAWAGQNYNDGGTPQLLLHGIEIESRRTELEADYFIWCLNYAVEPDARATLADSLYTNGAFGPALIQLRMIEKKRPLQAEESLLLLRCLAGSGFYDEILHEVDRIKDALPNRGDWMEYYGIALYKLNRILELKEFLAENEACLSAKQWYWGLLGNTAYALGEWERAKLAYQRALENSPDSPLLWENLGRVARRLSDEGRELEAQLKAADCYLQQEEYVDAWGVLGRIMESAAEDPRVIAFKGKLLFQEGSLDEAEELFGALVERGARDPSILLLLGTILVRRGESDRAERLILMAADGAPKEHIYQYKAAEFLHLRGRSPEPYLGRALDLEDDAWTLNLAGIVALDAGKNQSAVEMFSRALELTPEEADISVNLAIALDSSGSTDDALQFLEGQSGGEAANLRGNILTRLGRYGDALHAYSAALREEPENRSFLLNCASLCVELDRVHEAEELIVKLEEHGASWESRNILGNIAQLKGEFARAQAAYQSALEMEPKNPTTLINIAALDYQVGRLKEAHETLSAIPPECLSARGIRLLERVRGELFREFSCTGCSRSWVTPKEIPKQGPLKIRGELPDDAPAGICTQCKILLCVGCAKSSLSEGRFHCPQCSSPLSIKKDYIHYLLRKTLNID